MQYLVYVSAAAQLMNDDELGEILKASRVNNLKNNITGMLLYSDGTFIQVLEGSCNDVIATYKKIERDKRHTHIIKLAEGELTERLFADWAMAFKKATTKEFSNFSSFVAPDDLLLPDNHMHPAVTMLKTFFESNKMQ